MRLLLSRPSKAAARETMPRKGRRAQSARRWRGRLRTFGGGRENGAPERIRTPDLRLRRATLYPAELLARKAPAGHAGDINHEPPDGNVAAQRLPDSLYLTQLAPVLWCRWRKRAGIEKGAQLFPTLPQQRPFSQGSPARGMRTGPPRGRTGGPSGGFVVGRGRGGNRNAFRHRSFCAKHQDER